MVPGKRPSSSDSPSGSPYSAARLPDHVHRSQPSPTVPDHELLRCIGRGSYGEVWLARNALDQFRAVKVVYRRAFEDHRPFEREFDGIRKFEPISRSHPSQLHILHVGRSDVAGYFYYVMELADNATRYPRVQGAAMETSGIASIALATGSSIADLHSYVPRTLRSDLDAIGRLPPDRCLQMALALTTALEHLHEHGLVHRDIKPSNIIFVNGIPKLADIGLVAAMDQTLSVVGTSGFLPPEGPGTPTADLYSLGKVIYEMTMGRDRLEFPKLAADLAELTAPGLLLELNAVIVKACHHDPRQRYQSAKQMAADLLMLQRGHSVRRLRTIERRLAFMSKAGAVVSVMLLGAATLYWNASRQERATARQLYAADINLAFQAWEGGNVSLARQLLRAHQKRQPEMLGFEWRLLAHQCRQSDAHLTLRGHTKTIWSVAFSPKDQILATASGDGTVACWDSRSGGLLNTLVGHQGFVHAVAFSPDGKQLATGSRDFKIKFWDIDNGEEIASLAGHTDAVRSVAFSTDGQLLASSGEDKVLRWWNVATRQQVAFIETGFTIEQLAFSPAGDVLAGCGADNRVHLWNRATRTQKPPLEAHRAQVLSLAYASHGRLLATSSYDGTIRLWDTTAGAEIASLGRGAPVSCVAFASDDRFLAAAMEDGLIRLWDVASREVLSTLRGHNANVRSLAFSPAGNQLATGDEKGLVKLWKIGAEPGLETALKHSGIINSLDFSPDGLTLVTTDSVKDTLRLWNVETQQQLGAVQAASDSVWCVAFAPGGETLAVGGIDGTVRLWNRGNLSEEAVLRGHAGGVDCVAFSPDGGYLGSGSRDGTAKIWQLGRGNEIATLPSAGGVVRTVAFSPDGLTLAMGCGNGYLLLWDTRSFKQQAALSGHQGEIHALAFSPDGRTLTSGGADRLIRVWNLRKRKMVGSLAGHTAMISSLAFSAEGKTLVSGSSDTTVKLWNLRLLRDVATLKGHSGQVKDIAFSPNGEVLASASSDGTVRLWRAIPRD